MKVKVGVEYSMIKVTIVHDGNLDENSESVFCEIISKVHSISKQFLQQHNVFV